MSKKPMLLLSALLVVSSLIIFVFHFALFHDLHHILIYTVHDLAFLPIEALLVSLVLHNVIDSIQKKQMLKKMNMSVSMFFSEIGTKLLKIIIHLDSDETKICGKLLIKSTWKRGDYKEALTKIEELEGDLLLSVENLIALKSFLISQRSFVLRLLENPNLVEHEDFTDLLWAVFHLGEELIMRESLEDLPLNDVKHIDLDIMRSYKLLVREWLKHMEKLQINYPHLFSLALRTNPLDKTATVIFS